MIPATARTLLRRVTLLSLLALAPATLSATPATDAPQQWSINMKDTDIRDFIGAVANITGDTLIVDPRVVGDVSVTTQEPMTLPEVRRLFLSVMTVHGFAVIEETPRPGWCPTMKHTCSPMVAAVVRTRLKPAY